MHRSDILHEIYYGPGGMMGIDKLYEAAIKQEPSISKNDVREWYNQQPIAQMMKKNTNSEKKYAQYGHFLVTRPNFMHQADILYMPTDKNGAKFALTVVDAATRYKAARPLKTKSSKVVLAAFQDIYKNTLLKTPTILLCDNGPEFKGDVGQHYKIKYNEPGNHKSQAIVERFNRTLAERIFRQMNQKEIETNTKIDDWVYLLQPTIDALNNETTRMIGISPNEAMTMDNVELKIKAELDVPELSIGDTVRYKLGPDEFHDISNSVFNENQEVTHLVRKFERRRATDPVWSITKHKIISKSRKPGLPIMYYISGKRHGYTGANLMKVN